MKKKVRVQEYSPPPEIPHHVLETKNAISICKRCGFVFGSGNGRIPLCCEAAPEARKENHERGMIILKKLIDI